MERRNFLRAMAAIAIPLGEDRPRKAYSFITRPDWKDVFRKVHEDLHTKRYSTLAWYYGYSPIVDGYISIPYVRNPNIRQ